MNSDAKEESRKSSLRGARRYLRFGAATRDVSPARSRGTSPFSRGHSPFSRGTSPIGKNKSSSFIRPRLMRDDSNADFQVAVDHMLGEKSAEEDRWYVVINGSDEVLPSIEDDARKVPSEHEADAGAAREDSETLGGEKGPHEVSTQRQPPQKPKSSNTSAMDDSENFWTRRKPERSENLEKTKRPPDTVRRMALEG